MENSRFKFRAWSATENKYIAGYGEDIPLVITLGGELLAMVSEEEGNCLALSQDRNKLILEQFTGLRDKEGREIYENDVVKFSVFERFREMESEEIKVVKWVDGIPGGWSPFHLHTVVEDGFYNYEIESPQVIGNIHENPELLEASK